DVHLRVVVVTPVAALRAPHLDCGRGPGEVREREAPALVRARLLRVPGVERRVAEVVDRRQGLHHRALHGEVLLVDDAALEAVTGLELEIHAGGVLRRAGTDALADGRREPVAERAHHAPVLVPRELEPVRAVAGGLHDHTPATL